MTFTGYEKELAIFQPVMELNHDPIGEVGITDACIHFICEWMVKNSYILRRKVEWFIRQVFDADIRRAALAQFINGDA